MLLRAATLLLLVSCSLLDTPRVSAAPTDEPMSTRISESETCPAGCMCMMAPQSEAPGMMDVVCPTAEEIQAPEDPPIDVGVMDAIDFVEPFLSTDKTPEQVQKLNEDDSELQDASVEFKPMPIEIKEESSSTMQADEFKVDTAVNDVNSTVLKKEDDDSKSEEELENSEKDDSDSDSKPEILVSLPADPISVISKEQTVTETVQLRTEGTVLISLDDDIMQGDQPQSDDSENYDEDEEEEVPAGNEEVAETLIGDSDAKIVPKKEAPIQHFDEEQTTKNSADITAKPEEEENNIYSEEDSLKDAPLLTIDDAPSASSSETEEKEKVDPEIGAEEVATQKSPSVIAEVTAVPSHAEVKMEDDLPTDDGNKIMDADSGEDSSENSEESDVDAPLVFPDPPAITSEPHVAITNAPEPTEKILNSNPVVEDSNPAEESDSEEDLEDTSAPAIILSRIKQFDSEQQLLDPGTVLLPDGEVLSTGEQMDDAKSGKMISEEGESTTQPQQSTASWVILGLILTTFVSVLGYAAIRGRMDKRSEDRKAKSKAASSSKPPVIDSKVNRKPGIEGTEMKVLTHPLLQTRDEENLREFKDNKENGDLQKVVIADIPDSNSMPYIDDAPNAGQKLVKPPRKIGHAPPPPITIPSAPVASMNRSDPSALMSPTSPSAPSPTTPTLVRTRMVEHSPQVGRVTRNVVGNPFDE